MTEPLDQTQQRIVGVLIEKELTVPDSYPLTEHALLAGCNQKSNRDPEMGLEPFEVQGALHALMTAQWAKSATSTGGHATRYGHRLETHHPVSEGEKAVLCELLVRGPQAPGALKPRVARLGFRAGADEIEAVLRGLADRPEPLVEQLPRRPRERDHRWRHRLGPAAETEGVEASPPAPARAEPLDAEPGDADLTRRVEQLELEVAELRAELRRLAGG